MIEWPQSQLQFNKLLFLPFMFDEFLCTTYVVLPTHYQHNAYVFSLCEKLINVTKAMTAIILSHFSEN